MTHQLWLHTWMLLSLKFMVPTLTTLTLTLTLFLFQQPQSSCHVLQSHTCAPLKFNMLCTCVLTFGENKAAVLHLGRPSFQLWGVLSAHKINFVSLSTNITHCSLMHYKMLLSLSIFMHSNDVQVHSHDVQACTSMMCRHSCNQLTGSF
jgi:hypothetical protein